MRTPSSREVENAVSYLRTLVLACEYSGMAELLADGDNASDALKEACSYVCEPYSDELYEAAVQWIREEDGA